VKKLLKNFQNFNDKLADKLSYSLSAMATFYVILLLVLVPLIYNQPSNLVAWSAYLCSVLFQGIALPILGYTSRKGSEKADRMMEHIYRVTRDIETVVQVIDKQQKHMDQELDEILEIEKKEEKA